MAIDPKKRQKKLAQKAAKRNKFPAVKTKEGVSKIGQVLSMAREVELAKKLPIHECLIPAKLEIEGE
ncbi:MAG: hypothetical protein QF619_11045 [Candidatus Binatia bacterium]|jgi:hypothetical protein|nr:hypothetical protein [Candidatus Binatia bacterium]|tara:strand:- start:911 stop:1111 length:201 start_codon:yes stop_codon:yes gene_type:complete